MPDLLCIGHVARDEFPGEEDWRLGGAALYAAATAARLRARAVLVTRVGPGERERLAARCADLGIELRLLPSNVTTTFVFSFAPDGRRSLRLRARARGITLADVPGDLRRARAVVFASIAHELGADLVDGIAGSARVIVAQGYLRTWDADGTIRPRAWDEAAAAVAKVDATVVSDDDLPDPRVAEGWAAHGPVVVTLGDRGARLLTAAGSVDVPAYRADRVVDPTGAGDAFAAGLALALADGHALRDAVRDANAVASFAVEGIGTAGLAGRERVEARKRG